MRWEVDSYKMVGGERLTPKQVGDGRLRPLPHPLCICFSSVEYDFECLHVSLDIYYTHLVLPFLALR